MKRIARPTEIPTYIPGDFAALERARYQLTTESSMYIASVGSDSGLSSTERRSVIIRTVDGTPVMTFEYIRKYLKRGLRCNVTGFGGWDAETACIEAMTRHYVARFETRQAVAA